MPGVAEQKYPCYTSEKSTRFLTLGSEVIAFLNKFWVVNGPLVEDSSAQILAGLPQLVKKDGPHPCLCVAVSLRTDASVRVGLGLGYIILSSSFG